MPIINFKNYAKPHSSGIYSAGGGVSITGEELSVLLAENHNIIEGDLIMINTEGKGTKALPEKQYYNNILGIATRLTSDRAYYAPSGVVKLSKYNFQPAQPIYLRKKPSNELNLSTEISLNPSANEDLYVRVGEAISETSINVSIQKVIVK